MTEDVVFDKKKILEQFFFHFFMECGTERLVHFVSLKVALLCFVSSASLLFQCGAQLLIFVLQTRIIRSTEGELSGIICVLMKVISGKSRNIPSRSKPGC